MNRVLIVDATPEIRSLLRVLLQGQGYEVDEAHDGAEALVKARLNPPSLVVSDLLMSVMDGYTLLNHWKADERLRKIPFVVYTATYTEPTDKLLALDLGADAFILKRDAPEAFLARVREVLATDRRGDLRPARQQGVGENILLKKYNEVLIRKLEDKLVQLEQTGRDFQAEIAARTYSEALLSGQNRTLEMVAAGAPVAETLAALLQFLESQSADMFCSIQQLDDDGIHLRHGAAPSLPDAYNRAVDGIAIGPRAGSCGTAAFRRERVVVEDIATDPLWAGYRDLALPHGLRACWSTPIFDAAQRVLGTFAIYYHHPGRPTGQHERLIEIATHVAAIAIGRARDEAALRSSEARLRHLGDNLPGGMIYQVEREADGRKRFLYVSAAVARLNGVTAEAVLADPQVLYRQLHAEDAPRVAAAEAESLRTMSVFSVEARLCRADGEWRWVLLTSTPHPLPDGRVVWDGIEFDITERKRTEEKLRESEERLRLALDAAHMGTFDWDIPGNLIVWSRGHEELWGFKPGQFGGTYEEFSACVYPEDLPGINAEVARCIAARESFTREYRVVWPDGSLHWIQDCGDFTFGTDGEPLRMRGAVIETTVRRQTEEALRERERNLAETQRIAHIGSWVCDLTGRITLSDETYHILDVSPGTFAPTAEAFLGLIHPEERSAMRAWVTAGFAGEAIGELEFRHVLPDGTVRYASSRGQLFRDARNRPMQFAGTVQDITEHKLARLKLAANESRLRAIIDTEPECVKLLAADGSLLEMNAAGLRMLEADTFQQIENRCIYPLVVEEHRQAFKQLNEDIFAGRSGVLEFQIVSLKGARRWLETHASPLRDAAGRVTTSLGITRDITERKQAEEKDKQQLDELRRWYQATLGREERLMELKREVNDLLRRQGAPPRYASQEPPGPAPVQPS